MPVLWRKKSQKKSGTYRGSHTGSRRRRSLPPADGDDDEKEVTTIQCHDCVARTLIAITQAHQQQRVVDEPSACYVVIPEEDWITNPIADALLKPYHTRNDYIAHQNQKRMAKKKFKPADYSALASNASAGQKQNSVLLLEFQHNSGMAESYVAMFLKEILPRMAGFVSICRL